MSDILFRMAAKTDVGLERTNNEDNFQVSSNLDESPMRWVNNQEYSLGNKGALLVVADGMGGMNAGEVASEIAINTVREMFSPEKITDEVVKSRFTIEKFMKEVIVEADKRIKTFAKENPESRSMGTTIVIAWLFDGYLYVSWCGDSRAYIYNANTGLFQITKDHSYVQQLVEAGKISKEDAFDFPDSNIITRSLSDATPKANPDCLLMPQKLCNGDIILLCSDGLNGMIRDGKIEAIIAQHQGDMTECVDELIRAALEAAGADNCTVALCQIISGGGQSEIGRIPKYSITKNDIEPSDSSHSIKSNRRIIVWVCLAVCLCALASFFAWYFMKDRPVAPIKEPTTVMPDTAEVTTDTTRMVSNNEISEKSHDDSDNSNEEISSLQRKTNIVIDKLDKKSGKDIGKINPKGGSVSHPTDSLNKVKLTPIKDTTNNNPN